MIEIRRVFWHVEDIFHESGPVAAVPLRRGYIAGVLTNLYAGHYEPDILPMMEQLNPVGVRLAHELLAHLDVPAERIEGYGKGALIGSAGELEHGALWHVPGGYAMRELLGWKGNAADYAAGKGSTKGQPGNGLAIVPSTKKVAAPGATLDVPMTHINAAYVRSHFDAIEVRVPGSPRADELVVILAMSTGPRVHARVGGLKAEEIARWDGLR
ncbi:amino acid synthesis family protein [Noviherbaspirillum saxi]|uniref:Amino acid synthesis family protein n=1 Tax=Noviherbaspirillum saxi TaxID=2320863 RepID=A0A3A3G3M5_9BURK|nr:amino acid synthesis family protein [Noviherbaspirillum saxi]RJF96016.1 amino acid synthesis family protein [Noviherbaspirillum saxi]